MNADTAKQNTARANAHTFPTACRRYVPSLLLYYEQGKIPGNVLYSILRNDLKMAVEERDLDIRDNLARIVIWLKIHFIPHSWGSPEAMQAWHSHQGLMERELPQAQAEPEEAANV